jgi:RecA-family ATPase
VAGGEFRVLRAAEIEARPSAETPWLIEGLWGEGAVGVIGGAPKSCKTWLALEMAVAVASGRACLSRYAVPRPGRVLFYAAEDAPEQVRDRLCHLARARGAAFESLDVGLIVEASVRLDLKEHLQKLKFTLARHLPRLLVLDPRVRLQRVDENDATQVSTILAALREISRAYHLAVALVHHVRKNGAEAPGRALRGSSDFHAWGDSNLYVVRRRQTLTLSAEHRFAPSAPPVGLALVSDDGPVRLDVHELEEPASLADRIVECLAERAPRRPDELRQALGVRKQSLLEALRELEKAGRVHRTQDGWALPTI